ncbi:MAG: hydrolase 1, exosortase A system-associated [Sphingomonas sp. 28-66-16]|nr:MAG: hydrolase 1, exosortase A system-associated [Sphingomonas sp. 28-66-16]
MRELISFACAGETLVGTIDRCDGEEAPRTGLVIVSGGNEVRYGAHRGMAMLAAKIAANGFPVLRFDRRGIGDSSGVNGGFRQSRPDIEAAVAAFRKAIPGLDRLVAFGNCDAATALVLHGGDPFARLILANPWIIDTVGDDDDLPPADAIKARYAEKIRDPGSWGRLLTGGVNLRKLADGIAKIASSDTDQPEMLERAFFPALRKRADARIILAQGDATAIAFAAAARRANFAGSIEHIDTASHSFAREQDQAALLRLIMDALIEE